MKRLSLRTILTATAVAGMTLALVGPASADLTTRCDGEGGAVTIPTDLVVPRGKSCVLTGTVIQGDVRVAPDADLITTDVTIEGEVRVTGNAYLEMDQSTSGPIVLRGSFGTFLTDTEHDGDINAASGSEDYAGFVITDGAGVAGNVTVREGELLLENSDVTGDVIGRDGLYADLYTTFVDGEVRSLRNEDGSVVCESVIQGESRFVDNTLGVQLGGDGPLVNCDGTSYWGSEVRVAGTMGDTFIDNNIVNADLVLRNNDPVAVVGDGNMVRGDVIGDYEAAGASSAMAKLQSKTQARAAEKVAVRADAVEGKVDARRSDALADAAASGDAF